MKKNKKSFDEKSSLMDLTFSLFSASGLFDFIRESIHEAMAEFQSKPEQPKSCDESAYYTRSEVCQMARITETTLWRLEKAGIIRKIKLGRKNLYSRLDVEALLKSGGFCIATEKQRKEVAK